MYGVLFVAALSLAALLFAEFRKIASVRIVSKLISSGAFCVGACLIAPDFGPVTVWMAAGFTLSFVGDALLLSGKKKWFLVGLVAFLLAHIAYAGSFVERGVNWSQAGFWLGGVTCCGVWVLRWLLPYTSGAMRPAVIAYVLTISVMVGLGIATGSIMLALAALAFMISDLAVARQRFVSPTPFNKLWGLPLYFGAQWGFVWSLSAV